MSDRPNFVFGEGFGKPPITGKLPVAQPQSTPPGREGVVKNSIDGPYNPKNGHKGLSWNMQHPKTIGQFREPAPGTNHSSPPISDPLKKAQPNKLPPKA
jgi:hypothetical protein